MMGDGEMKEFRCRQCRQIFMVARIKDADRIKHKCHRCRRISIYRVRNYEQVEVKLAEAVAQ